MFLCEYIDTINSGSMSTTWGLAIGLILFIAAAAIKIAAGMITQRAKVTENS